MYQQYLLPVVNQSIEATYSLEKLREKGLLSHKPVFKQRSDARLSILQKFKEQQKFYEIVKEGQQNQPVQPQLSGQRNPTNTVNNLISNILSGAGNPNDNLMSRFLEAINRMNQTDNQFNEVDIMGYDADDEVDEFTGADDDDDYEDINDDEDQTSQDQQ